MGRQYYTVMDLKSGEILYPQADDRGYSESLAAKALVKGTTYGVGWTPEMARRQAKKNRDKIVAATGA